ncbi:hypothetical protein MesoLjLa_05230 [Mesorhizobium sp. L-2-11]|nr:hypothetical protein MesoLjLa_05230 [Mesorhizobium sp. L-2-11]
MIPTIALAAERHGAEPFKCRGIAPPSVLPDISPTWGEIGSFGAPLTPATVAIGEGGGDGRSPPKWGRCPAGQRGREGSLQMAILEVSDRRFHIGFVAAAVVYRISFILRLFDTIV